MTDKKISNQEVKGTKDWLPEEFGIRKYIFDKWRQVCLSYGFLEYLTPLLENADIYRAKSGEDIGGKELMVFVDQGDRELAIRPEMTPSVVRLVSKIYPTASKPLRLFSLANFFRNEKPQRGRNREFWQLNCDIFGDDSIQSDLEILQLSIDLVSSFNPPKDSFILKVSHRQLLDSLFSLLKIEENMKIGLMRLMDKYNKMSQDELISRMKEIGLESDQIDLIFKFLTSENIEMLVDKIPELKDSSGWQSLVNIFEKLNGLGLLGYVKFSPEIIRGFDYYDGLIFEVFDLHPDNNRAMFGGGRYNGLASVFGVKNFPAIGFAPGDETFRLFLSVWDILPKNNLKDDVYLFPILSDNLEKESLLLASKMRKNGIKVEVGFGLNKISRALEYADKSKIDYVIILGEDEFAKGVYKIKNMSSGQEEIKKIN
ncbi:MAG: histidine--tRNA ligase [Patescibacteria group bacterium]|jgi:histidyl-tRNA synthetase